MYAEPVTSTNSGGREVEFIDTDDTPPAAIKEARLDADEE